MSLPKGTRFGPYEVQTLIGEGGMGQVYRAVDTRLNRIVAVKVLPPHFADNAEMKERFEREAQTIAGLNHPNICTLYDVGHQDDTDYLVMEFLEGETLAQRLGRGALPLNEALKIGIEVADALDKAHRKGVVHRDFKPGNIMLTASGPKLLDFGLAKLTASTSPASQSFLKTKGSSQLPTGPLTVQGTILGTLQYMPPEQLEGHDADARADIFAFGAVLYEMITGRAAFQGNSQVTLIAAIVSSEPQPPSTLHPDTPPLLDHVIKRCLAKNPDARWQTASDLCQELKWITEEKPEKPSLQQVTNVRGRMWMAVSAVLALLMIAAAFLYLRTPLPESIPMRLSVLPAADSTFSTASGGAPWPALSPDGRRMVFGAVSKEGKAKLFMRPLDSDTPQVLNGTEDGQQPFWSPDGRFIAYFDDRKLKKIDTAGGAPQIICDTGGGSREGTWGPDGTIIFAATNGPLFRVAAAGGQPEPLTQLDKARGDTRHMYPSFLPDGRNFVFLVQASGTEQAFIAIGSLDAKTVKHLLGINSKAHYAAPGYLLYVRDAALVAQPFDPKRLELSGQASPIVQNIRHTVESGIAAFSVANNGTIAFRAGEATENYQLAWFDRSGRELSRIGEAGSFLDPEISPDGKLVALGRSTDSNRDVLLLELARGVFSRFTFDTALNVTPLWSRDGGKIAYAKSSTQSLFVKAVGGGTQEEVLIKDRKGIPDDWSPDGKFIISESGLDLWVLPLEGDRRPYALMQTGFSELEARFSPNGRWITYSSNESGRYEVYAQSFPSNESKIQISTNGGTKARWSRDGKEIFYMGPDEKLMAVTVSGDKKLDVSPPAPLFQTSTGILSTVGRTRRQPYDVSADGKRFLVLTTVQTKPPAPVSVFANWQAALKPAVH